MASGGHVLVSTSDRYNLEWERERLAAIPDFPFDLRAAAPATPDEMIAVARDADALLLSSREPLGREVIEQLGRCKVVARYAVGLDHIDLDAAADHGIVVTHYPMYCTAEVADHALALLLALNRRIVQFDRDLRDGVWVWEAHHLDRIPARSRPGAARIDGRRRRCRPNWERGHRPPAPIRPPRARP